MTSLERELMAMAQRENAARRPTFNIRAYRQFFPAKAAAKEAPKMNGVEMNPNGTLTIGGQTYTRDEFRAALEENMKAQRADPKSAYNDRRHPEHAQAVSEMALGYKFMAGELTESDEKEIVNEWHEATQESGEVANAQPYQQIAELMRDPEARTALQRAKVGQPLDARQRAIVQRHNELEAQNNTVARREAASKGGWMKTTRPHYISPELYRIEAIKDPRERAHAIRAEKSRLRDDPKFSDSAHPDHKSAVNWMDRLYRAEAELPQPEDENR